MSSHAPAPAENHKDEAKVEAPKNDAKPIRNIEVERKRTQELLDNTLGKETARNFKLTGSEAGDVTRSAALVAAAERNEREAIDAVLRAESETERAEYVRQQIRATQNKVRAQAEFNTIANRANTRVMPERDDAPHSTIRTALREYGVPVAGALGIGVTAMANAFGAGKASTFLLGLLNPQTLLGTYAYGGGYIGAFVAGGWLGGKLEQTRRTSFGRSAGTGTLGKALGAVTAASGMTLMLPGTLPSAAVGASFYGMYKVYNWFKTQRFRATPAYRNAEYLRTLNAASLTALGKPAKMESNIVGTNLVLTFEKKEKTVDVSAAPTHADVDLLIQTGMHELEHEVHEEHNKHNEVNYRTLLKTWTVPKDITLDFSHAYDHRIRYLYKGAPVPPLPPYEVNCTAFPESDADAFKNMFDAEVQATIQRVDSADPVNRAKKFTALLNGIKLPDGVDINLTNATNKIVHFTYEGLPSPVFDCSSFADDAVATLVTKRAESYKKEREDAKTTPAMKFTALLSGLNLPDGVSLELTNPAGRIVQVRYEGNNSPDIDCSTVGDAGVASIVLDRAKAWKKDAEDAKLTPAIKFTKLLRGINPLPQRMTLDQTGAPTRQLSLLYYGSSHPIDCTHIHDDAVPDLVNREIVSFRDRIDLQRKMEFEAELVKVTFGVPGMTYERSGSRALKLDFCGLVRNVDCMDTQNGDIVVFIDQEIAALNTAGIAKRHREILEWVGQYQPPKRVVVSVNPLLPFQIRMNRTPKKGPPPPEEILDATSLMSRDQLEAEVTRRLIALGWKK